LSIEANPIKAKKRLKSFAQHWWMFKNQTHNTRSLQSAAIAITGGMQQKHAVRVAGELCALSRAALSRRVRENVGPKRRPGHLIGAARRIVYALLGLS
jgi:hypothetical protein